MTLGEVEKKLKEIGFQKYTGHVWHSTFKEINGWSDKDTLEVILPNKKVIKLKPELEIDGKKIGEIKFEFTITPNEVILYFLIENGA